ncbi:MAG: hypothetical protein DWH79_02970 [Planctomycetota bacterium]|nr:MAG: hypothetical protein DWH79_02970 [Planctomycetota bacterium]
MARFHRQAAVVHAVVASTLTLVTIGVPLQTSAQDPAQAPVQTAEEPPRKGLGGLFGKAAERLKEEAMKRFDKNGDGRLDDAEQAEAMNSLKKKGGEVQAQLKQFMLGKFDADSSGTLDETERKAAFDETMKQMEQNGPMVKNTILGMVYRRFDANADGTLDSNEMKTARHELSKRILQGMSGDDAAPKPTAPQPRRKQADEATKKEMLDRFDADGDGVLSDQERAAAKADLKKRAEALDDAARGDNP